MAPGTEETHETLQDPGKRPRTIRTAPRSVEEFLITVSLSRSQNFAFFPSLATMFLLSSLSWGSSRGILVVYEAPESSNVHVWSSLHTNANTNTNNNTNNTQPQRQHKQQQQNNNSNNMNFGQNTKIGQSWCGQSWSSPRLAKVGWHDRGTQCLVAENSVGRKSPSGKWLLPVSAQRCAPISSSAL